MPGYSAKAISNNARNANTVAVLLGTVVIAFAQTVSHDISFGTEGLFGIGTAKPQELQQMKMSPHISLSMFALTADGQTALAGNDVIGYSLVGNQYDLHIVDGNTNQVLFSYIGCTAERFSQTITANQPVTQDIPFMAMDVWDSNGNSILDGNDAVSISSLSAAAGTAAGGLGVSV